MAGAFESASYQVAAETVAPEAWVGRVWFRFVDLDDPEPEPEDRRRAAAPASIGPEPQPA